MPQLLFIYLSVSFLILLFFFPFIFLITQNEVAPCSLQKFYRRPTLFFFVSLIDLIHGLTEPDWPV
jgi:hypothetical protein